jgi:tripartite-type tricarboxylate transporter receptor subunit TctC
MAAMAALATLATLGATAALALPGAALAQAAPAPGVDPPGTAWPAGPVRVIVPFPPGGSGDHVARLVADELSKRFNQQFVLENRPGANTQIGNELVARARPDGLTLLATTTPFVVLAAIYPKLPYDTLNDFAPVARIAENGMVLVAHPSAAGTLEALLAQSRLHPGSATFASMGNTGVSFMASQLLAAQAGIQITVVPYKGTGQAMPDLLGGQVSYFFDNPGSSIPYIRSGKLRALAFTGKTRLPALPEVPTLAESGLPDYDAVNWYGLFAPARTPAPILDRLHEAVTETLGRPDIQERLAGEGINGAPASRAAFAAFVRAELARWSRIASERRIRPE